MVLVIRDWLNNKLSMAGNLRFVKYKPQSSYAAMRCLKIWGLVHELNVMKIETLNINGFFTIAIIK